MRTAFDWQAILLQLNVKPYTAQEWGNVFYKCIKTDTFASSNDLANFLGQILHESAMLSRLEENLNYSAARLTAVWPNRFPTIEDAEPFAKSPVRLANKVYGGRMGNVDPGDGYRYRGRGLLMITGKDNYRKAGADIGIDLVAGPDLLALPEIALKTSVAWWKRNIPPSILSDVALVTKRVNGGTIGLQERQELTAKAKEIV